MKKVISILTALALLAALAGCGSTKTSTDSGEVSDTKETSTTAATLTPASAPKASLQSDAAKEPAPVFRQTAGIEETVLYDADGLVITATELSYTAYSAELKLLIENNSGEDLSLYSGTYGYCVNSVNEFMFPNGYLHCDVAAGKKAADSISFDYQDLLLCGITEIAELQLGFEISDDNYDSIYTGPLALSTSAAASYVPDEHAYENALKNSTLQSTLGFQVDYFAEADHVIANGVHAVSAAALSNNSGETLLCVELANDTAGALELGLQEIGVNGLMIEPDCRTAETVNPGKHVLLTVAVEDIMNPACLTAFGVSEIGALSCSLALLGEYGEAIAAVPLEFSIPGRETEFSTDAEEIGTVGDVKLYFVDLLSDTDKYDDDLHLLLIAYNQGSTPVILDSDYGSVSVNGFMTDCSLYSFEVQPGMFVAYDAVLYHMYLEDLGITSADEVDNVEFTLEIRDKNWHTLDEAVITIVP